MSVEPKCSACWNCGSTWSPATEEYYLQQCSACGWMPGMPVDEDDPDYDDGDMWDDDADYGDPNWS